EGGPGGYWPRVWAARGLFHAWDDGATAAIVEATADEAWRVREMAARTIGRHHVGDGLEAVARLLEDPVPRVRTAARTALERLVAARD
ncbi:MAG: HEAT repeat domain-containing protein, partial [Candidatus Dormibacteraeota bacterium]|nr:HEAT repeat domain-containing protein [Candidatus Dormibacteraeota bacterium]